MTKQMNASRITTNCLIFALGIWTYAICLSCANHRADNENADDNISRDLRVGALISHTSCESAKLDERLNLFGKSLCKIDSVDRQDHLLAGPAGRVKLVAELKSDLADMRLQTSSPFADQLGIIPSYIAVEQAMVEPRALIINVAPIVNRYRD